MAGYKKLVAALAVVMVASLVATSSPASAAIGDRIGGADRFETAALIGEQFFCDPDVVVANGRDFPDGLAGSVFGERILLTDVDALPPATVGELDRIDNNCGGLNEVRVLGGAAAVSSAVFDQLATNYAPTSLQRLGGTNRYETAIEIATAFGVGTDVFLATGSNFPDALAAGPVAGNEGWPIILNDGATLRPEVKQFFEDNPGITTVHILGGTGAVPASVADQLNGELGKIVHRLAGANRFETAVAIADEFMSLLGFAPPVPGELLVNGNAFADALAAGPLGDMTNRPILLVNDSLPIPAATEAWNEQNAPNQVVAIGGAAVLSDAVLDEKVAQATPTAAGIATAEVVNTDVVQGRWRLTAGGINALIVVADVGTAVNGAAGNEWQVRFVDNNDPDLANASVTVNADATPPFFEVTANFGAVTRGEVRDVWNASPAAALTTAFAGNPGANINGTPPTRTTGSPGGLLGRTTSRLTVSFDKAVNDPTLFAAGELEVFDGAGAGLLVDAVAAFSQIFIAPDIVEVTWWSIADVDLLPMPGDQVRIAAGQVLTDPFGVVNPALTALIVP